MGSTTAGGIPYPVATDTPDVPRDIKALADWLQANSPRVAATAAVLPAGMAVGTKVWQTDEARVKVWNGTAWEYERGFYAMAAGSVAIGTISATSGISTAVTFPTSRFSQVPMVGSLSANNGFTANSAASVSTTGVSLKTYNPTGSAQSTGTVQWTAVQMTSASGPGLLLDAERDVVAGDQHESDVAAALAAAELSASYHATCHTGGCGNEGARIPMLLDPDPDAPPLVAVVCGVCGEPITDLEGITL